MKKIIVALLIFFLSFNLSFAKDNAPICYGSPPKLTNYFSTIINVLHQIKISQNQNPGGAAGLGRKAVDVGFGAFGIATIFTIDGIGNFFQNFIVLKEPYYIVRDWIKLINFKQYITKTYLKAANYGILEQDIPDNSLEKIKQIAKNNPFFITGANLQKIEEIKTYSDFFSYIWQNQQQIEKIYFNCVVKGNDSSSFDGHAKTLCEDLRNIYLNNGKKYTCGMGLSEIFKKLINQLKQNLSKGTTEAKNKFTCNGKRLKAAALRGDINAVNQAKCGNVKLQKWVPLNQRIKANTDDVIKFGIFIKTIFVATFDALSGAAHMAGRVISAFIPKKYPSCVVCGYDGVYKCLSSDKLGDTKSDIYKKKCGDDFKGYKSSNKKEIIKYISTKFSNISQELSQNIKNLNSQIKNELAEVNNKSLIVNPTSITYPIVQTSIYIWAGTCILDSENPGCKNRQQTMGTKGKEIFQKYKITKKGIYQNLVETCENQSPFIGNCRY